MSSELFRDESVNAQTTTSVTDAAPAGDMSWLNSIRALKQMQPEETAEEEVSEAPRAVSSEARTGVSYDQDLVRPPVPEHLEETGLSETLVEHIILKNLYFRGEVTGRALAAGVGLKFSVIEQTLDNLKRLQLIVLKKSLGMGNVSGSFSLSESGRQVAREYLQNNQYSGKAPVPIDQYATIVRHQRLADSWLTKEKLIEALRGLVLTHELINQLGPAVNAGKSFLIYGQPGNGKTYLAEALFNIQSTPIYIPYAIEAQGQIIQLYDPVYHQPVDPPRDESYDSVLAVSEDMPFDGRFLRVKRPFITTGGELTLSMLDLSLNPASKVYDAPFQLKANNGIYLIDDFGRQRVTPAEVLNRWIVPMERKTDFLSFETGGKMTVPFECFLIFSTNLNPNQLGDEAFLRRIQYKMMLKSPHEVEFREIFFRFCREKELPCEVETYERFVQSHYFETDKRMRRCHPRDVLTKAIDLIKFERLPFELTEDVLNRAFEANFVEIDHTKD